MNRRTLGYILFVIVAIVILTSLPFFVGQINPIYLVLIMSAIGFLWVILRIYIRRKPIAEER